MFKLFNIKNRKQLLFLMIVTIFTLFVFKEKYILIQISVLIVWLYFYLKTKVEEILPVTVSIFFILFSAIIYVFSKEAAAVFLNEGMILLTLSLIYKIVRHGRETEKYEEY